MNKTTKREMKPENKILVDTDELQQVLSSGRSTAVKIGTEAGARIKVGRRIFWNASKVKNYVNSVCE